jgi:hypothetical protein
LLGPSGVPFPGATARIWQAFPEAALLADRLELDGRRGGLAFIIPPSKDAGCYGAVFFTAKPAVPIGPDGVALRTWGTADGKPPQIPISDRPMGPGSFFGYVLLLGRWGWLPAAAFTPDVPGRTDGDGKGQP